MAVADFVMDWQVVSAHAQCACQGQCVTVIQ